MLEAGKSYGNKSGTACVLWNPRLMKAVQGRSEDPLVKYITNMSEISLAMPKEISNETQGTTDLK